MKVRTGMEKSKIIMNLNRIPFSTSYIVLKQWNMFEKIEEYHYANLHQTIE